MPITIRPLTPVFGAEITGIDLNHLDAAGFAAVDLAPCGPRQLQRGG
jgi:alpha-ketoglutarate-dependent taurine dioxygenase